MARIYKRTVQKDLQDPHNHNGVITHLEPDILEFEVKWALGSITLNKASGGDGIPVELFQILKDDAVCCTQYASKSEKLSSGHRTGKGQFSFQKKGNAKECSNYHTTALISHSSKVMLKILQAREEGSGWGTRVYLWGIHVDIWQNQYNIVKLKNKIKNRKKIKLFKNL